MKWPDLNMTEENASLYRLVGGVGFFVGGLAGWEPDSGLSDAAQLATAFGAAMIAWALFSKHKPG
jgi:hypothetical protein